VAAAGLLLVAPIGLAACGSGGGGTSAATTTTVDPLAETVVDACGHDLSTSTSRVTAVDPTTGTVRWTASVPLASAYLLRDASGGVLVPLERRSVDVLLDVETGAVVGYPPAGVHEVLVDVNGATDSGVAGLLVDGEPQPATIEVAGLRLTTSAGETGQATVGLTATDAATATPAWRVELGAADAVGSLTRPVAFGDTVVVVASPPLPVC
jgi:outer membrane protein assembly factor BamB